MAGSPSGHGKFHLKDLSTELAVVAVGEIGPKVVCRSTAIATSFQDLRHAVHVTRHHQVRELHSFQPRILTKCAAKKAVTPENLSNASPMISPMISQFSWERDGKGGKKKLGAESRVVARRSRTVAHQQSGQAATVGQQPQVLPQLHDCIASQIQQRRRRVQLSLALAFPGASHL